MVLRKDLEEFLKTYYKSEEYDDYCLNGLQVQGRDEIRRIALGVSFNLALLQKALAGKADAIVVHHGIFGRDFFHLRGIRKHKVGLLLEHDMSLFGMHLPMDSHADSGHNALMAKWLGLEEKTPMGFGFWGNNRKRISLDRMLEILREKLGVELPAGSDFLPHPDDYEQNPFGLMYRKGFMLLENGPAIPEKVGIISGGSAGAYEDALEKGVDTFICGEIKEHVPAISLETETSFVNLGHYYSEKPGVMALAEILAAKFDVHTWFADIPNTI